MNAGVVARSVLDSGGGAFLSKGGTNLLLPLCLTYSVRHLIRRLLRLTTPETGTASKRKSVEHMPLTLHARTPSAALTAMEGIKEYIRSNQLAPGDVLPSEATLCEQLGYSRSSIREAMRILSTLDIVEVRHGYGTYVSQMSLEPLVNGLIFRTVLEAERSFDGLISLVDAREALDISLGRQLIDALDAETEAKLRALAEKMSQEREGDEPFTASDQEFHNQLMAKVSNPLIQELTDVFRRVHTAVAPALGLDSGESVQHTVEAHVQILDALHEGDVLAYEEAVRKHYAPLRAAILKRAEERGFTEGNEATEG